MANIDLKYSYTDNPLYEYETELKRENLDEMRKFDIKTGNGFIVNHIGDITKDLKNINSIFSSKFGLGLDDQTPTMIRYVCECRSTKGKVNEGTICPICGTKVEYVDDNFSYRGWNVLNDEYYVIHPNLYKLIESFIGKNILDNIIKPNDEKDKESFKKKPTKMTKKNEKFFGIGMFEFKERFDEIMDYYHNIKKSKDDAIYYDIMENKENIFTHSYPVITALLRPYSLNDRIFNYNDINGHYNMLAKLVKELNNDHLRMSRKKKQKKQLLYDIQKKIITIDNEIDAVLSGKKGVCRALFGGRYTFSARDVIKPDLSLEIDQVKLSYFTLVVLLENSIISFLMKTNNMLMPDAREIWSRATIEVDNMVLNIIRTMIKNSEYGGIPILINRNPTLIYGGIDQVFVVDVTLDSYTMSISLQITDKLNADFDGDVMNILYIINHDFFLECYNKLNPRNCHYISKNDGLFDNDANFKKNIIVNHSTLINMGRKNYSNEMIEKIKRLQKQY